MRIIFGNEREPAGGPDYLRFLRKVQPRKKNSVILSEGEQEMRLTEEFRRAEVEEPGWPGRGGASYRKLSFRQNGGLAWLGASQIRFGHSR
jgi:hypothetical protein